jgi:hypothetical protein
MASTKSLKNINVVKISDELNKTSEIKPKQKSTEKVENELSLRDSRMKKRL